MVVEPLVQDDFVEVPKVGVVQYRSIEEIEQQSGFLWHKYLIINHAN